MSPINVFARYHILVLIFVLGALPTVVVSAAPTLLPSFRPSSSSPINTRNPTLAPTVSPVSTKTPTQYPSVIPSSIPTAIPSKPPTVKPSILPSALPSLQPSSVPTTAPSCAPTITPSKVPTSTPSTFPSLLPTKLPSTAPSFAPTLAPTLGPSLTPTISPSSTPSILPTLGPSFEPSTLPTSAPSTIPTGSPSIVRPTVRPTPGPSAAVQSNSIVAGIPNVILIAVVALGGSLCLLAIMGVVFLRFYRAKEDPYDLGEEADTYGKSQSSKSSRYPVDAFDLQALYRSVNVDPSRDADSDQASRRESGHSAGAVAASSSGRPSIPPLRSTSRTRATSGSYSGLSPVEYADEYADGGDDDNDDNMLDPTSATTASAYEDEERVYYHGGEAYTVTERVLRRSNSSKSLGSKPAPPPPPLPSRTSPQRDSQSFKSVARRSRRRDLLFEPADIELGTRNTSANTGEAEPLVYSARNGTVALSSSKGVPAGRMAVGRMAAEPTLSRRRDSSCDSVPAPEADTEQQASSSRSAPRSIVHSSQVESNSAVYVSSSMK